MVRYYIPHKYMPPRPPTGFAIVMWLLLDRLQAPGWAYGVVYTFVALLVIAWLMALVKSKPHPGWPKFMGDA